MGADRFIVIGENVHTTRIVAKKGKRFAVVAGQEGIPFTSVDGEPGFLPVPEWFKSGQDYRAGRIKHIALAVRAAMNGEACADTGAEYLRRAVADQEQAGAHFLDINVDEISLRPQEQREAMVWLVHFVRSVSALPISVDSSEITVIEAGLRVAGGEGERALLNSASLERMEAVDLAVEHDCRVIVTASGSEGMPAAAQERMDNASRMVEVAVSKGISEADIFVDPLVFPVSVDSAYGLHVLDAMRGLRDRFGDQIHITGGMSNVSFGLPARRLLNAAFIHLAASAGADSGIIDPVMNPMEKVRGVDTDSPAYRIAEDALLGRDEFCLNYLKAWRAGELA